MHRGLGLQGMAPRPSPSRKKGPAQSNPLEKFISESGLETSGALMRVSPHTQPPASNPGTLQVLGHSDQKDFLCSNQSLRPIFPGLGALMAEGEHLGVSTTPPPTPSEKTLKKQWLEVLSTYQYVLCFCFLGKGSQAGVQLGRWQKGKVEGGRLEHPLLDHQGKGRDVRSLSPVPLFPTPRTVVYKAPLSIGFSRQEYWSELPFSSPGDLPDSRIEPGSPALQTDTLPSEPLGKPRAKGWFSR